MITYLFIVGAIGADEDLVLGGTKTQFGEYYVHEFTSSGTFAINSNYKLLNAEILLIGGGGGGAGPNGGGGGAGGMYNELIPELDGSIPVTVGSGGAGQHSGRGYDGGDTIFGPSQSGRLARGGGGGGGGSSYTSGSVGSNGGSGGGGGGCGGIYGGGEGTQGEDGATGTNNGIGGGGGGYYGQGSGRTPGLGFYTNFTGTYRYFCAGGMGGQQIEWATDNGDAATVVGSGGNGAYGYCSYYYYRGGTGGSGFRGAAFIRYKGGSLKTK